MQYEWKCPQCGKEAVITCKVDERNNPVACPTCGADMERKVSGMQFALKGWGWTNKKS